MSKIVVSLPKGMVRDGVIGALVSLICYVLLQFLAAFLISKEMMGEEMLYSEVYISSGISSFVGCLCGLFRGKRGVGLSAATVVAVFFVLTLMIGFCFGETRGFCDGFAWVGVSISVGGLMAALIYGLGGGSTKKKRELGHGRRSKR